MQPSDIALLIGAGIVSGIVNTLAGAGSLLTVPILVLIGLPGTVANGTNRVGVLANNLVAAWRFRANGLSEFRTAGAVILPTVFGSAIGAYLISLVSDKMFEKLFGVVMLVLLYPMLRSIGPQRAPANWSPRTSFAVFFAIGIYGGAFQAGVGLALIFAFVYAGYDLMRTNSIKVVVNAALTATVIPVFLWRQQIAWGPGIVLAIGYAIGSVLGVRLAVIGGEKIIRPVLALSVVALAGRMIGLY